MGEMSGAQLRGRTLMVAAFSAVSFPIALVATFVIFPQLGGHLRAALALVITWVVYEVASRVLYRCPSCGAPLRSFFAEITNPGEKMFPSECPKCHVSLAP